VTFSMDRFAKSWTSAALCLAIGIALLFGLPGVLDDYTLIQVTIYAVMSILGVSLAFIWGFGGILCFGQAAFFGLGSYTYAIAVMNLGDSTYPFLLAIALPALFAAILGYVIFYGRLSDVYMGVITLTVTLILFNLINSTAGPEWKIGTAPLGGFNGIPGIATLNMPGNPDDVLSPKGIFYVTFVSLLVVYLGLRVLIASKIGRVIVAAKENEQRVVLLAGLCLMVLAGIGGVFAETLPQLIAARFFQALGGAIAGLAGCLFANWGAFTSPTIFGLAQSAQIIIWVIVGGLGTLVGPIVGCVAIQWLTTQIGTQQTFNSNLVLGAILVVFVLMVPRGIVPSLGLVVDWAVRKLRRAGASSKSPAVDTVGAMSLPGFSSRCGSVVAARAAVRSGSKSTNHWCGLW